MHTINRARHVPLLAVALVCAALLLAACGGSSNKSSGSSHGNSSGSSQGSSAGGSGTSDPTADSSKAERFSQCMRTHGEPAFPDPGANGKISIEVTKGGSLQPNSATYQSAEQKCKSLEPAGFGGGGAPNPAQQNKMLEFVDCMRKNGVPNMPDPQANGAMVMKGGQGGIDPQSPAFQAAMQKCRSILPGGGNGSSASAG